MDFKKVLASIFACALLSISGCSAGVMDMCSNIARTDCGSIVRKVLCGGAILVGGESLVCHVHDCFGDDEWVPNYTPLSYPKGFAPEDWTKTKRAFGVGESLACIALGFLGIFG